MIFEMTGDMIRFGRGYSLNDVVYIDNVRHECIRWTRQMKKGKEVVEFELVPMEAPAEEIYIPTVFIDDDCRDDEDDEMIAMEDKP